MKKIYFVLPFLLIGLFFWFKSGDLIPQGSKINLQHIPGDRPEDNGKLRREWDRMRLADPATGLIPEGISYLERQFASSMVQPVVERNIDGVWEPRGPWNVGGRTRTVVLDVTNEAHILAGSVSGGIWESNDAGQSWVRRTPLNAHPGVVSIAQDTRPGKTNIWYAMSGEIYGTSASGGGSFYLGDGMFKSTDNGQTWLPITVTAQGTPNSFTIFWQGGWRVITDPSAPLDQDVLYAATYGAVYRSTNGGTSWTAVRGGPAQSADAYYVDVAITSTGVLYAVLSSDGTQKGIWRSINGTAWTNITPTTGFPTAYNRFVIGINPNNENEVWFLGSTPGFGHVSKFIDSDDWSSLWKYTYISGNGSGAEGTWEDRSLNLPNTGTQFDRYACQGGYDLVVKVQPVTNNVFIGGTCAFRSTDGFATPNNTTQIGGYKIGTDLPFFEIYPNQHPDEHDMVFLPSNPNVLFIASDGGVHRTDDCLAPFVEWTSLNRGYQTTQFYTAIIEKSTAGDPAIIGGLQDNGNFMTNSADPNAIWKQTVNGDGAFGAIPDGKPFYVLSIQQGRVVKCAIDDNNNVTAFRRFDPVGRQKSDYMFINTLALDPKDQNKLYLPAGRYFYRQDDLAAIDLTGEWDSIAQGWTRFPDTLSAIVDNSAEHNFSAIAVSEANPSHRVYLGTTRNKLYRIDNANTGTPNWTALTTPPGSGGTTAYVSCIAVDPDNADDVFVVYSNYNIYSIFRSLDGGQTWFKAGGTLEANIAGSGNGPSIRWMSILPFGNGKRKYFCGTSVGLYSADTIKQHVSNTVIGTAWAQEGADVIGSAVVGFVDVRASEGLVVAATHGSGMFTATFSPPSSTKNPSIGSSVRVSPNPSQSYIDFRWDSNQDSQPVQIQVFNMNGTVVRSGNGQNGFAHFDIASLPSGTYLYQINGKKWSKSGKVVKI